MSDDAIRNAMAAVWQRSRSAILDRVTVIENATLALLNGQLTVEARRDAERQAHRLAGAVGTFGFWDASKLARSAEVLLAGDAPIPPADVLTLSNLTVQIRRQLEGTPDDEAGSERRTSNATRASRKKLLLVSRDAEFRERLALEVRSLGIEILCAEDVAETRAMLGRSVHAVVLDLTADHIGLPFLEELHAAHPELPVVVISDGDAFQDRVDAARLGGRGFFQKPVRPAQIFELLRDTLVVAREEMPTIVAVDDDSTVLASIDALLAPLGANVVQCGDPLRALSILVEHSPDLVMLDVDMPGVSGIELCRVLRNDPRWAAVPILFLTSRVDRENITQMFEAGADDFVAKPVLGPELVARVRNRLERTRMLRLAADVDSLTGVATRRRGIEVLERYFRLGQRHAQPISMAVIDLDHFKQVNDQYGHVVGDMVLRRVAAILAGCFRGEDVVARWGGEEFVVGMYTMPAEAAVRRMQSALEKLRNEIFEAGAVTFTVSFSAGIAEYPTDGGDWTVLYRLADNALSKAKGSGRDRVIRATAES